ncbi:Zn(2)-C6 fungal-type domain-containing protein [Fusarium sp. Ph1]|nr:Zn(2)-C6 fungal-type domain-containing protein [Fusarium sp. Ph1]
MVNGSAGSDPHRVGQGQAEPGTGTNLKRKRTSRACDQCRVGKRRCDGERPACMACINTGTVCSYGEGGRKRGLPTGYVKSLELLFGLVFTAVPNGEEVVSQLLAKSQFTLEPGGKFSLISRLASETDTPRTAWNESQVQQELDRRLKCLDASGEDDGTLESDAGNTQQPAPSAEEFDISIPLLDGIPTPDEAGPSSSSTQGRVQQLPVHGSQEARHFPDNSQRLLDLYFSLTHCWLPLVEKHKLFQVLFSTPNADTPDSSGNLAVFWAVLAYSSLQEHSRQEDNSLGESNHASLSSRAYENARRLIPDEDQPTGTGHVQALIVMSLCRIRRGTLKSASRLLGQAVRICLLELAMPDPNGHTSRSDERLLLACFALDTFLSCSTGAPPHLKSSNIESIQPLDESGPDEWDPWVVGYGQHDSSRTWPLHGAFEPLRAASTFNTWVHVACVLNDAICEPSGRHNASSLMRLGASLQRCRDQLPAHCKPPPRLKTHNGGHNIPAWSPHLLNLHLALAFTENWVQARQPGRSATIGLPEQLDTNPIHALLRSIKASPEAWMLPPLVDCYRGPRNQAVLPPRTASVQSANPGSASKLWDFSTSEEPTQGTPGGSVSNMNTSLTPKSAQMQTMSPSTQNSTIGYSWMLEPAIMHQGSHLVPNPISTWEEICGPDNSDVGDLSILDNADWLTDESAQFMQNLGFATGISETPQGPDPHT